MPCSLWWMQYVRDARGVAMWQSWIAGAMSLLLVFCVSPSLAWNEGGHMVSGAMAYSELKQDSPKALARAVMLLQDHPDYPDTWAREVEKPFVPLEERELYLFMLAARWPDDIRGHPRFDHPRWHYINLPYTPAGGPARAQPIAPLSEHIVSAYATNLSIVRSAAPNSERAMALCWVFHLIGDVHQPLHTVTLVTPQFPPPEGDRGGTRFYIRVRGDRSTISLHAFWDDLIVGTSRFQTVRNTAAVLRHQPGHARRELSELAETRFEQWAQGESFLLAQEYAYRRGTLRGSADKAHGIVLPADYPRTVKPIAERRIVLAGYRLADVLKQLFE
jgi:hypothetical protein